MFPETSIRPHHSAEKKPKRSRRQAPYYDDRISRLRLQRLSHDVVVRRTGRAGRHRDTPPLAARLHPSCVRSTRCKPCTVVGCRRQRILDGLQHQWPVRFRVSRPNPPSYAPGWSGQLLHGGQSRSREHAQRCRHQLWACCPLRRQRQRAMRPRRGCACGRAQAQASQVCPSATAWAVGWRARLTLVVLVARRRRRGARRRSHSPPRRVSSSVCVRTGPLWRARAGWRGQSAHTRAHSRTHRRARAPDGVRRAPLGSAHVRWCCSHLRMG